MPSLVKEVTSGASVSKSQGQGGQAANSIARAFRVVLNSPSEVVSFESACGVSVGSPHPSDSSLVCTSYDARYDGDSRMVALVTFQYGPKDTGGGDQPPTSRPANWSISASTMEVPVRFWRKRIGENQWDGLRVAANSARDLYDGVSKLAPLVTISVSQWEDTDPTEHAGFVGYINDEQIALGSLTIRPHQLLFNSLTTTPAVETWGGQTYRGWRAEYQFLYKKNTTIIDYGPGQRYLDVDIGWDIAVPQAGRNVIAVDEWPVDPAVDVFAQPLRHGERGTRDYGRVVVDPNNGAVNLPEGVNAGDRVQAMVRVFSYQGGGFSQAPSAQPVLLNDDGTPRRISTALGNLPIVYAYQVYESANLSQSLGLRLY